MRILWVTNVKLPIIYNLQGKENKTNVGGWLDRISQGILNDSENTLLVCYPFQHNEAGSNKNLLYQGIAFNQVKMRCGLLKKSNYDSIIRKTIVDFKPDIIHIHGTEFQYAWFFTEILKELDLIERVIISIQGLVSVYAKHFLLRLPTLIQQAHTIQELVAHSNIKASYKNFILRGKFEEAAIKNVQHIMGRTSWDKACTYRINPDAKYHIGNETLREVFYNGKWSVKNCIRHSIFISQASYPIKGFHAFLEALSDIKRFYPDVRVRVAGVDLSKSNWIKGSSYALYIVHLIKKLNLEDNVQFLGNLSADKMQKEMLVSNVFVSPSNIENSPNSVGEAMLLSVPVVSSDVGGVADMVMHGIEGFVYSYDAPYMLAYYIMKIFENDDLAVRLGEAAHQKAVKTHCFQNNLAMLMRVYEEICGGI